MRRNLLPAKRAWPTCQAWFFLPLLLVLAGCPVTQRQDTPRDAVRLTEHDAGAKYWLYVPSYYGQEDQSDPASSARAANGWPLVVTLHGTHGWDDGRMQINEWKYLAEQEGFIVAAPDLRSVQGILPVSREMWYRDLDADEKAILAVIDDVSGGYRIDPQAVLLTGFSAGGYPLYHVGLRHPGRFSMLIARGCNSSIDIFERIELTDMVRKLPVAVIWGKDDLHEVHRQSWQAIRWLSEHGFESLYREKTGGGHLRRPEVAYSYWQKHLSKRQRQ